MNFCYLYLTCDSKEADSLTELLLKERLIACVKKVPVNSTYWWEGSIEKANETMLVMESAEELFDKVESLLKTNHSYDTFVLTAVPMARISYDAQAWLKSNLESKSK